MKTCYECGRKVPNANHPVPGKDGEAWCWLCAGLKPDHHEITVYAEDLEAICHSAGAAYAIADFNDFMEQACWEGEHERAAACAVLGMLLATRFSAANIAGLSMEPYEVFLRALATQAKLPDEASREAPRRTVFVPRHKATR